MAVTSKTINRLAVHHKMDFGPIYSPTRVSAVNKDPQYYLPTVDKPSVSFQSFEESEQPESEEEEESEEDIEGNLNR